METFDYIIIGAGSAGCVLANRLSANPNNKVLVIEAGDEDKNFWIKVPAGFRKLLNHPTLNWNFKTEPEAGVGDRSIPIPRGKAIGGSSSINGMLFVRGQTLDYDQWAQLGNRGWSYANVMPFFSRIENFERGGDELRGASGPLNVADMRERHEMIDAFIEAGVECGFERNPDYNGARQDGFGYYQVTQKKGQRVSAADAYLTPVRTRANLKVIANARTKRLVIDGRRVFGIVYDTDGKEFEAHAERSVIVSAGAVQSPQLLELSGIGQPKLLQGYGIKVKHALAGVGENYRDHYTARINWRVKQPITLNQQVRGLSLAREVLKYFLAGRGVLTFTAGIGHGFVRTRPELETPDCQFFFAHASFGDINTRALEKEPGMTIGVCQLRPESRGSIHIGSADPLADPIIRPNFLSDQIDRDTLVAGLKMARQIGEAPALAKYTVHEMKPGADCETNEALLDYVRMTGATVYHPIGTCRMGIRDDAMAVVDERLRVHGLEGLRVVDASVMPTMPSGNTNAPVLMVAEKAADMIIEDAG